MFDKMTKEELFKQWKKRIEILEAVLNTQMMMRDFEKARLKLTYQKIKDTQFYLNWYRSKIKDQIRSEQKAKRKKRKSNSRTFQSNQNA